MIDFDFWDIPPPPEYLRWWRQCLLKLHGNSGNPIENIPFQKINGAIRLPWIKRPELTRSIKDRPESGRSIFGLSSVPFHRIRGKHPLRSEPDPGTRTQLQFYFFPRLIGVIRAFFAEFGAKQDKMTRSDGKPLAPFFVIGVTFFASIVFRAEPYEQPYTPPWALALLAFALSLCYTLHLLIDFVFESTIMIQTRPLIFQQ